LHFGLLATLRFCQEFLFGQSGLLCSQSATFFLRALLFYFLRFAFLG
jgi:hypothetical protein